MVSYKKLWKLLIDKNMNKKSSPNLCVNSEIRYNEIG